MEEPRNEGTTNTPPTTEEEAGQGSADQPLEEQEAGANPQWEEGDAHSSAGDQHVAPLPDEGRDTPSDDDLTEEDEDEDL